MSRIDVDTDFEVATVTSGERLCLALQPDMTICQAPTDDVYRLGCVHEHVRDVPLCPACAELTEQGYGNCRICLFEVDDPHQCRMTGRRLP